jgi:hypothetical protein
MPEPANPDLRKLLANLKKALPAGKLQVKWDDMDDCYAVSVPSGEHSFYPVLEGYQGSEGKEGKEVCKFFVAAVNGIEALLDFVDAARQLSESGDCGRALEDELAALDAVIKRSQL